MQINRNVKLSVDAKIFLSFRTDLADGIVFYLDSSDAASFVALTLRAGLLRVQYLSGFIPEQLISE
jgi:hypothetical protein